MHEELINLLEEWKKFKNEYGNHQTRHIAEKELRLLGASIENKVTQMRVTGKLSEVTDDEKDTIEEVFSFLVTEVI